MNFVEYEQIHTEQKSKEKTNRMKWIFVGTVIVIFAVLISGYAIYNTPTNKLSRQLDLGNRYLEEQNYEQAVVEFDKAIEIDPMSVEAYLGKAEAYEGIKNYELAIETYKTVLEIDSDLEKIFDRVERVYLNYAQTYIAAGDFDKAISILQEGDELLESDAIKAGIKEVRKRISFVELEKFKGLKQTCSNAYTNFGPSYYSFLTYEEKDKVYRPIADDLEDYIKLLLDYQDVSDQIYELANQNDIYGINEYMTLICAYNYLANIYLKLSEMDKCLYNRSKYLELAEIELESGTYKIGSETYDKYGRKIREQYEGKTSYRTYEYNENNQIISEYSWSTHNTWKIEYEYVADGRLIKEVQWIDDSLNCIITYEYPRAGIVSMKTNFPNYSESFEEKEINQYGIIIDND